jgi:tetratricopeptide (TPR) repeat protein
MSFDISDLLSSWDYQPGQVSARRFKGQDGKEKLQLRVDLGILQMNAEGRPDGKRPFGSESWYEVQQSRLSEFRRKNKGSEEGFRLDGDAIGKLQQEAIQYHHRYICFFQLKDFAAVESDCDRNLDVFEFVSRYAASEELAWALLQFTPQLLMMRARARGTALVRRRKYESAIKAIEDGIESLEEFYRGHGREDLLEQSGELTSLQQWLEDVRSKRPVTPMERLKKALEEAIRLEDYEKAAVVRDQMRKLETSE